MSFLSVPVGISTLFPNNRTITVPIVPPLVQDTTIIVQVVINESTNDTLTITKQPVQQGASITDHSFKEPTTLNMTAYFRDNRLNFTGSQNLNSIYQQLQSVQNLRVPLIVTTPKRVYTNMLMTTLGMTTDKNTENCLAIQMSFQQVILVSVGTTTVPRQKQKNPGSTGATQPAGQKTSGLKSVDQGLGGAFSKFLGITT